MTTPQNTSADPVAIRVTASTDNSNDSGYNHSFEQKHGVTLTFAVKTDPSVDSIYFVLWSLYNPGNPELVESQPAVRVKNGEATIVIGPDPHLHLGPGPYCATLTASSPAAASTGGRKIVDHAIYYYETWPRRIY
jgi:hypothetical protein